MISRNKIKYIRSLELKKKRKEEGVFVAEGHKLVGDLLNHFHCRMIISTPNWLKQQASLKADEIIEVSNEELTRVSLLKTPQDVLAIFEQPNNNAEVLPSELGLCLALDDIQDPGNLGTIIRLADWFGIEHIYCSHNTVDVYNSKTIQATMGALARVKIHYVNLPEFITSISKEVPVYGTFLDGDNIYEKELSSNGIIVMGNEGNGISEKISRLIDKRLYIPNYPRERTTSESLNVATATAVICAEFRRRSIQSF